MTIKAVTDKLAQSTIVTVKEGLIVSLEINIGHESTRQVLIERRLASLGLNEVALQVIRGSQATGRDFDIVERLYSSVVTDQSQLIETMDTLMNRILFLQ